MTTKDVAVWLGIASSIAAAGASFAVTQERVRVLSAEVESLKADEGTATQVRELTCFVARLHNAPHPACP